jgi:PIN domain nuclease of toxin-antitoxin system
MPPLEQIAAAVLDTNAWVWMSAGAPEARKAAMLIIKSIQ